MANSQSDVEKQCPDESPFKPIFSKARKSTILFRQRSACSPDDCTEIMQPPELSLFIKCLKSVNQGADWQFLIGMTDNLRHSQLGNKEFDSRRSLQYWFKFLTISNQTSSEKTDRM
jgi:hypothetical protein